MSKHKPLPPLKRLLEVFRCDEEGRLFWKCSPNRYGRIMPGTQAASIDAFGYMRVKLDGQCYKVHRIVWAMINKKDPGELQIDHINRDKLDNRPSNLRLATGLQNMQNRIDPVTSATGERCIYYNPPRCKAKPYVVRVRRKYLGLFASLEEAKRVRDDYLNSIRSEFTASCE